MTEQQTVAWNALNNLYNSYHVKPLGFGRTVPKMNDAIPYDQPGILKDWSKDKRKTNIPDYSKKEVKEESSNEVPV